MTDLPVEFANRMKALLQEEWTDFLNCYDNDRYYGLRFNTLKVPREKEKELLGILADGGEEEFPEIPWARDAWYYPESIRPGKHIFHESGLYYIQEPSAMSAAALLAPRPGMKILDLCAAPGGKTTQLASYLNGQGLLVANEINPGRCRILSQNVERMGIENCLVVNEDSAALAARFPVFFHGILVDAPCSGEGMFRKNEMASEEWSQENVLLCAGRQEEILDNAARMLAPGGRLVYSTCTFAPEENEISIFRFLKRHPEFSVEAQTAPYFAPAHPEWVPEIMAGEENPGIEKTFRLWPHKLKGEGHYAAVLRKEGRLPEIISEEPLPSVADYLSGGKGKEKTKGKNSRNSMACGKTSGGKSSCGKNGSGRNGGGKTASREIPDQEQLQLLVEFLQENLTEEAAAHILSGRLILFGDQIYRLPPQAPPLAGIHVLRAGLQLGEYRKNRFEPSHSLALALSPGQVKRTIILSASDERSRAYFRGETFPVAGEDFAGKEAPDNGWCLIAPEGFSAGWCKYTGGSIKNHYPKGLRVLL